MQLHFNPEDYGAYLEQDFRYRWLRQEILLQKLEKYRRSPRLRFDEFGQSEEGRPLLHISFGHGPVKVLIWTQMHGNEPTATMAVADLLNFLTVTDDYNFLREYLEHSLTILIIPMLNPDGAERFTRRNACNIDMNRDALRLQSLEMQAFITLFKAFKPHWAFNMHDQRNFFSAGPSGNTATISFLSASADALRTLTPVRQQSMQLIGALAEVVEDQCEDHCGRYTDEYYPTALGEFFHRQEVPCVLVESGAFPGDEYRDMARKLNFLILLRAFHLIASEDYLEYDPGLYQAIPENGKAILDLVIRNCRLQTPSRTITADLGFMMEETADPEAKTLQKRYRLTEIGDLSFYYGIAEKEGGTVCSMEDLVLEKPAELEILLPDNQKIIFEKGILQ